MHQLEATGQYVFHGSPVPDIEELEIRQAYEWEGDNKTEDGPPAVVATPYSDIAIFRALVYMDSTSFGIDDHGPHFSATDKALKLAKEEVGYVYVLPKNIFRPKEGDEKTMDWRSHQPTKPARIIKVSFEDLPDSIAKIE